MDKPSLAHGYEKWTVCQLKKFLKERGIPSSGYKKFQLVSLVAKAHNSPELEEIEPAVMRRQGRGEQSRYLGGSSYFQVWCIIVSVDTLISG